MKDLSYLHRSNAENNELTREALETALSLLFKEKTIDRISITDLVKKAGVARNSFYRNYDSKEDVLRSILQEKFAQLASHNVVRFQKNPQEGIEALLEFIADDFDFFKLMLSENLRCLIEEEIYRYQPDAFQENNDIDRIRNYFVASGTSRILADWIGDKNHYSPKEMAAICYRLIED
ncbi:TetR/AcrR family transcriptional regulator [Streptococcus pluranimalium]|uniref:TetR/AcrR family transcriptional regulator n=1 Tax=Streptococcus pluranimalium TaxID=82348 RepID=UPI004046D4E7